MFIAVCTAVEVGFTSNSSIISENLESARVEVFFHGINSVTVQVNVTLTSNTTGAYVCVI